MRNALLLVVLCLAPGTAAAQESRPLPQCRNAETARLIRDHNFGELLVLYQRQLAQLDPRRTDVPAVAASVCLRAHAGISLARLDRAKEALAVLVPVVDEARAKLGPEHPETLSAELLAAYAYGSAGQMQNKIQLLQSLRPRITKVYGARSSHMRNVLNDLSNAYHWTGNFQDALPLELEAVAISEADLRGAQCAKSIADCRVALARSKQHLADTLRRIDRAKEAVPYAEEGVAVQAEILGATHPNTLDARLVLASVHGKLGDYLRALEIEREVLALAEKHHGTDHAVTRKARGNLASSLITAGKGQEARELEYLQLQQLRERRGANHPETLLALANHSDSLLRIGDVDKALPLLEDALKAMLATRSGLAFDDRLTLAWQSRWKRVVDDYIGALLRKKRLGDAFLVNEYFKARLLADRLSLDPSERALDEEERTSLRKMKRSLATLEQAAALKRSMRRPTGQEDAARTALLQQIAEVRPAAEAQATLPSAKQPPDWYLTLYRAEQASARVSYMVLRGMLYAFADRGGQVEVFHLGNADAVRDTIDAYRAAMRPGRGEKPATIWKRGMGGYSTEKPHAEAQQVTDPAVLLEYLSDILIKPLAADLRGKSRLIISPYQGIAYTPFDALSLDGARLGDKLEVVQIPSFALHAQLARRIAEYGKLERRPFLGFGGAPYQRAQRVGNHMIVLKERDVRFQPMDLKVIAQSVRKDPAKLQLAFLSQAAGFPDLPGTLDEVRSIARRIGGSAFYLGEERASEENLNRLADDGELAKYKVVHFAAHGFLSDDEPALSAVVLSQINRAPGTDGYVTVAELSALELRADLVVISACDSGIGKLQHGEGLLGMSYALFQAGTVASMVTLWPVADHDTSRLMMRFYEEMSAPGVTPSRALALAKRWALANGISSRTVDAFVLFGA